MNQTTRSRPSFPRPPRTVTDEADRTVELRVADEAADLDPLVESYARFDDDSRAQGLPPRSRSRIREWVADLLEHGLNVVAVHDGELVGHATLIPFEDTVELSIFVRPDYQYAGIGTELLATLLGHGQANDVDEVWLAVSGHNGPAVSLYESAGFETTARRGGTWEMERAL